MTTKAQIDPRIVEAKKKFDELSEIAADLQRDGILLEFRYLGTGPRFEVGANSLTLVVSITP